MYLSLYLLAAVALLSLGALIGWMIARRYRKYDGEMVLTCPETKDRAVVSLNAHRAVATELAGNASLHLDTCSRWPERENCDQGCLGEVDPLDPHSSLVIARAAKWFEGRNCSICEREFHNIEADQHLPALLTSGGITISLDDIAAAEMDTTLAASLPVCWRCHVAESFRQTHPELVTDRYVSSV